MNKIVAAFAFAILAGLLTLGALEVGWQAAYNRELAARGGQDPMDDWHSTGEGVFIWIQPETGPGSDFVPHGPPYPEPLGAIYGR